MSRQCVWTFAIFLLKSINLLLHSIQTIQGIFAAQYYAAADECRGGVEAGAVDVKGRWGRLFFVQGECVQSAVFV